MNERGEQIEAAFHAAQDCDTPEERERYLTGLGANDPELRREVEALMVSAAAADAVFPAVQDAPPRVEFGEEAGTIIGRYKLLERIGEGGMGVVYRAEQQEPVRRQVALKIIKLGMDTRQVVARFEAERQALALMDHPNIAKVLDGGAVGDERSADSRSADFSPQGCADRPELAPNLDPASNRAVRRTEVRAPSSLGRPYFVMELVKGVPMTEFCEQHQLSIEQRLRLFVPVCQAVQHAHQKGIIHRDLKPSNVMVTLQDGVPVPKVIDFGVAKALHQRLTEKTLFTQHATLIGTPAYMSPEQAEMSPAGAADVDTRSDVYSLGVLLYELLTGTQPFPEQRLRSMAYAEMQRILLHEQPERPSTRLRKLAATAAPSLLGTDHESRITNHGSRITDHASRSTDPRSLAADLDWIVLKCLEKDRNRRYETANGLAADLQRHLADEPVMARPPSAAYRFRKLVRRNKLQFTTAAAMALVLIAASVVSTRQALRATRAQAIANAEAAKSRQAEQLARAEAVRATEAEAQATEQAEAANAVKSFLLENLLGTYAGGESLEPDAASYEATQALLYKVARQMENRFTNQPQIEADIRQALVRGFFSTRDHQSIVAQAERLVELDGHLFGPYHTNTLKAIMDLGYAQYHVGQREEGMRLLTETISAVRALDWPEGLTMLEPLQGTYGLLLLHEGRTDEALPYLREAVAAARRVAPDSTASRAWGSALAGALEEAGRWPESEQLWRELLESCLRDRDPTDPQTVDKQFGLARVLVRQRRTDEALPVLSSLIASFQMRVGSNNFSTLRARCWQALALDQKGDTAAVTTLYLDLYPRFQNYIAYVGARYSFEEMASFFVRQRNYAPAKAAYESLRTVFETKPPVNAAEFETYIQATAATKGWPAVGDICRTHFDSFPDSLWIWLNKAWVFRYVGDEKSWGRVVESVLALPPALISTNDQHVPIEIAALGSLPFSADRVRQLDAMIQALASVLPGRSTNQMAWGYRAIGHMQLRLGRFDEALAALATSASYQAPPDPYNLFLQAACLHRLRRAGEARAAFEQAEALLDPDLRKLPPAFEGFRPAWQIYQQLLVYRETQTLLGVTATPP